MNLVQHKVNEKILRCKFETYQKNFLNFTYGSLTNTEALD
jgi:hypothetical protein